jgi:hypothetical protein
MILVQHEPLGLTGRISLPFFIRWKVAMRVGLRRNLIEVYAAH